MGPLGYRYNEDDDYWEVDIYPTPVELIGGAVDGEVIAPGFGLDVEELRSAFEYTKKWYGSKERYQFGTTFRAGREGELQAQPDLLRLVDDPLTPVLVRATALSLLGRYQGEEVTAAFRKALAGEESLLRRTACASFPGPMNARQAEVIAPLVDDPDRRCGWKRHGH